MKLYQLELPYQPDSQLLFSKINHLPWAVWLDSSFPYASQGRYDIMCADPFIKITVHNKRTLIQHSDNTEKYSMDNSLSILEEILEPLQIDKNSDLPFTGGALGFISYDVARQLEKLPEHAAPIAGMDDMALGIYDWGILTDHAEQKTWLVSQLQHPQTPEKLKDLLTLLSSHTAPILTPFQLTTPFVSNMTFATYQTRFDKIKNYILAGDCYQVNLAQRFAAQYSGDPYAIYLQLRQQNPAPFAAFLNYPDYQIVSCSPEQFIKTNGCEVTAKPIKGTHPRHLDPAQDQIYATILQNSLKDRAENLMIVDLLRNDLGKTCLTGSINVPSLFSIESFTGIHHLVSTIIGRLKQPHDSLDLLRGCFPGGSITGAPKLRAMQIIEELEPDRRSVYCGSIGYIGFDGNMNFNIAIRTLLCKQSTVYCYAGGAIIHDSVVEKEYQECLTKIQAIFKTMVKPKFTS